MSDLPESVYVWPNAWVEAAVKAGLGERVESGIQITGGDAMRYKLATFASLITLKPPAED